MKSKLLMIFLALLQFFSFVSFAEDEEGGIVVSLVRSEENGKIVQYMKVDGVAEGGFENRPVTLTVIRPGGESETGKAKFAALHQGYVEEDLTFSFEFPFNEPEGIYSVYAKVPGCDADDTNIECYSTDLLIALLGDVEAESITAEALSEELINNGKRLGIDVSLFSRLDGDTREDISERIIISEGTHKLNTFNEALNEGIAFIGLSSSSEPPVKQEIIERYDGKLFNVKSLFTYEKYVEEDDYFKNKALNNLEGSDTSDAKKLETAFNGAVFRASLSELKNYSEIEDVAEFYKSLLDEEAVNEFAGLSSSDKKLVCKEINSNKKNIGSCEQFSRLLASSLENLPKLRAEAIKNASSGSGGGGGGGSAPAKKIEVEKEEVKAPEPVEQIEIVSFSDLSGYDWAVKSINALKEKGVLSGRSSTEFAPGEAITRAEFAKMLSVAFEFDKEKENSFSDMEGHWAVEYVNGLAGKGIIQGTGKGYNPESDITREDACVMIYRVLFAKMYKFNVTDVKLSFTDKDEISEYARTGVGTLSAMETVKGFPDGSFGAKRSITRAEAAVLLTNVVNLF